MVPSGEPCFSGRLVAPCQSRLCHLARSKRWAKPQHAPVLINNLFILSILASPEGQGSGHFGRSLRVITLLEELRRSAARCISSDCQQPDRHWICKTGNGQKGAMTLDSFHP